MPVTINGRAVNDNDDDFTIALASILETGMRKFYEEIQRTGGAAPGQVPSWDEIAWTRLIALGHDPDDYMLMHHESATRAGFKNRDTRTYVWA